MNNLKLRNKIFLILVLPMMAIFMLSSVLIFEKFERVVDMNKTSSYIDFTVELSKLLKQLQKERELAVLYIKNYGEEINKDEFERQIKSSISTQKELENFINNFELIKKDKILLEKLEVLKKSLAFINEKRASAVELSLDSKTLENFYNEVITTLMSFFDELLVYSKSKELLKASQTYISIISIIEKTYKEKDLIKNIFNYNIISNKDYNSFISLLIFQDADINELKGNLTKEQLEYFYKKFEDSIFKNIENSRRVIFLKIEKESLINTIKDALGYGGLIHLYKDFILTSDENILNQIQRNHTKILRAIKDYQKLEYSNEEKNLLNDIQNAIDIYMAKSFNSEYVEDTKELDLKTLKALEYLSKHIYGANIEDWEKSSSQKIEILEDIKEKIVNDTLAFIDVNVKDSDNQILLFFISLIVLTLLIFLVIMIMTSNVTKSIKKFEKNLEEFFSYSMKEKDEIKLNKLEGKDEFALMTKNMNTQVLKIEKITENDKQAILEIADIMGKVNNGFFEYSIKAKPSTKELKTLVEIINKMLDRTRLKIDSLNLLLSQYSEGNYQFKLDEVHTKGMYGDFGILCNSTILLGQSSSQLIAMITNAGKKLEENTKILTNSSNELAISSSNQAISLKQTSLSLEEITQNLKKNNENMNKMKYIADELNSAVNQGSKSATQTFNSMDEISKKVKAINEAITVIDQIAFQTNILSLNAAVEAATAGEVGKGFAVVASEVRELANKSANAAKEIKDLVESANLETNDGKMIADTMIKGYENLTSKILQTKDIIHNVTLFSKEQESGIIQINETVSKLDFAIQENAQTASNIDKLSNEVSNLSDKLLQITSASKIDEKYYDMVENVDLMKYISSYKNDHINFKKRYFKTLDTFEDCMVDSCKICNLGKWIVTCENRKETFVKDEKWQKLKLNHENMHKKLQEYVSQNASKVENQVLRKIASQIEDSTIQVFDSLNDILYLESKINKK
ncbi:methyl-accepting chemotaxis protein [Aliarcobacter lanthieri]|uniref:methyl-accepting chemotaxis protein n=1 Tax=Aliarcobacter lanthieri TaxID=1355374 RepID=UPI003AB0FE7D